MKRETHQSNDGSDYIKVTYPKFKLGEEVVREVAVLPTYSKDTETFFVTTHFSVFVITWDPLLFMLSSN